MIADPIDDVSGAIGVAYDAVERLPDLAQVGRSAGPENSGPHGRCCARWRSVA